jgi:hypothetical protein
MAGYAKKSSSKGRKSPIQQEQKNKMGRKVASGGGRGSKAKRTLSKMSKKY